MISHINTSFKRQPFDNRYEAMVHREIKTFFWGARHDDYPFELLLSDSVTAIKELTHKILASCVSCSSTRCTSFKNVLVLWVTYCIHTVYALHCILFWK